MGNALNMIIIMGAISMVLAIIGFADLGVAQSLGVKSNLPFLGNYIFTVDQNGAKSDIIGSSIGNNSNGYYYSKVNSSQLPEQSTTGNGLTSGFLFPDWLNSGFNWLKQVAITYLNIIGAPFTLLLMLNVPSAIAAPIGAFFSVIFLFLIVNWILGREN